MATKIPLTHKHVDTDALTTSPVKTEEVEAYFNSLRDEHYSGGGSTAGEIAHQASHSKSFHDFVEAGMDYGVGPDAFFAAGYQFAQFQRLNAD